MKKIEKILIFFVILCMLFCVSALSASAETVGSGSCGENVTWTLDNVGTLTVSGMGDMADWSSASDVPWYGVRNQIEAVIIENGVTKIGSRALKTATKSAR